jgi:hypothetical protein
VTAGVAEGSLAGTAGVAEGSLAGTADVAAGHPLGVTAEKPLGSSDIN